MDEIIKGKDEIIKDKDDIIKGKDEIIKTKDEIIKGKDDTIKGKDSELRRADETITTLRETITRLDATIKSKDETITELNTELFVAQGKLTLRAAVEEVETLYVSPECPAPTKRQSMRDCMWTWMLTRQPKVRRAFDIEDDKDVPKWVGVAKSLYRKHGSEPLHYCYYIDMKRLVFNTQKLSEDQIAFASRMFRLLDLNAVTSP
jgi:hypothetical protein